MERWGIKRLKLLEQEHRRLKLSEPRRCRVLGPTAEHHHRAIRNGSGHARRAASEDFSRESLAIALGQSITGELVRLGALRIARRTEVTPLR